MTILAAIGEIARFPSPEKLVGYSGLGASVHASGQTFQTDAITKQGRRELRTALIEAAWIAVRHHPYWQAQFERLSSRKGAGKAIVAIARKLLVAIWHVLTKQAADLHADPSVSPVSSGAGLKSTARLHGWGCLGSRLYGPILTACRWAKS